MFRQIYFATQALKVFIKMTHCVGDRCTVGTFNDDLSWVQELESGKENLENCLDNVEAHGGTRLYDSLCDAVDYLCEHGDRLHSWFIFAMTYNSDDKSIRSAKECKNYISEKYANIKNHYIFVISVGKNVNNTELDSMEIKNCLYHVHVKSSLVLENDLLWRISLGEIVSNRTSAMDYITLVNNSASMGVLKPLKQHPSAGLGAKAGAQTKASSETTSGTTQVPQVLQVPQSSQNSAQESYTARSPEREVESRPPPAPPVPPVSSGLPEPRRQGITIRMRQFFNNDLHPSDKQIFREFAVKNYPNIPNSWEEDDIEFLVLVESGARSIVGLLVMLPYENGRVHLRLMVVDKEFRGHGLGTRMLAYVAGKYRDRVVTLNVAFDRLDLLNFYYDKGYVKFEEFSTKHKVICFSLVHLKLLATMPFPG